MFIFRHRLWHLRHVASKCYPQRVQWDPVPQHALAVLLLLAQYGKKKLAGVRIAEIFQIYGPSQIPNVYPCKWPVSCSSEEAGVVMSGPEKGGEWKRGMWTTGGLSMLLLLLLWATTAEVSCSWYGGAHKNIQTLSPAPRKICVSKQPTFLFLTLASGPHFYIQTQRDQTPLLRSDSM